MNSVYSRRFTYTISEQDAGQTAEQFLRSQGYSKNLIVQLRKNPMGITMDGELIYTTRRLLKGDRLSILLTEEESSANIVPSAMPLDVVYEDGDILIINKAAGVPIHPSQGNFSNTLANAAAWYFQQKQEPFIYRAVNRLDRDTTGLLILARHSLAACILSEMVARREIHREYLAVAEGRVPDAGTISAPIARVDGSTIERCVDFETGEAAVTHYRCLRYNATYDCSLVSLRLETGRTHQIRVHMKYIGHPLPGDFLYNPDYRLIGRQALHSCRLSFLHPITKKELHFEAPLPDDMKFVTET
ncbi:RluA family pseudouridine synthase [Clostridium sp. AM58-1XD]|uniref:RluA family pseudouridine synthase n=1 Tax=Clostridium sp. AM58-1XD TaxID=2292307 RepID=UPI000E4DB620|nr:RluA family pseudouridine synthase [Clostridium sp. AM58-1XD]RGY98710.1 RluA family pseudouridine synthase [Clostridium sp. AM58-1XD]